MGDRRLRFFSIGWRGGRACRTADTLKPPVADGFLRTTVSARPSRRIPISFQVFTGVFLFLIFCNIANRPGNRGSSREALSRFPAGRGPVGRTGFVWRSGFFWTLPTIGWAGPDKPKEQ